MQCCARHTVGDADLSLGCSRMAVNRRAAAEKASSKTEVQLRSSARHSGCLSCSQNCVHEAELSKAGIAVLCLYASSSELYMRTLITFASHKACQSCRGPGQAVQMVMCSNVHVTQS